MASPPTNGSDSTGSACPYCGERHPASYTHCPKTGKTLTTGRALIGRTIAERYRIIGLLGEGGMGAVYVAEHVHIGRKVAIKRLHPELVADEKAVQRFQREARAAAATGHEHIVEILDLGFAEDGAPYLVMEYLRGQSLASLLRKEGKLDPHRACDLLGQVLAALDSVHKQQIVHRDLKPDNIFLTRRQGAGEWVKILDFGISKMKREDGEPLDLTRTGVMLGTPFYMSPEQARGAKDLDHRVDLYAAGVILYECLTGRVPYEGENYHQLLQSILRDQPPAPRTFAPHLDAALEGTVLRAIAKEPNARYVTASAMLAALLPFGARPSSMDGVIQYGSSLDDADSTPPPGLSPVPSGEPVSNAEIIGRMTAIAERTGPSDLERRSGDRWRHQKPTVVRSTPAALGHMAYPLSGTASGTGSRYFYATSEDWDEARVRAITETQSGRSARESSQPGWEGPLPRENARLRETGGARDNGARDHAARDHGAYDQSENNTPQALLRDSGALRDNALLRDSGALRDNALLRDSGALRDNGSIRDGASSRDSAWSRENGTGSPLSRESPSGPSDPRSSSRRTPRGDGRRKSDPELPPPLASSADTPATATGEAEVKGALVAAALEFLELSHGDKTMLGIAAQLDAETAERLQRVILPMAWLPLATYEQMLRAAERVIGAGEGATSVAIGRATADKELSTTHRLFLQTANPATAVERIPALYRSYHSRGQLEFSSLPGSGLRIDLDAGAREGLHYCAVFAGFFQRMLELTGARDVRASVIAYRGRGDERSAVALRWK